MADIKSMFHQIKVCPQHRDALRFLWWRDGDPSQRPMFYRVTVHPFGGMWSPSCATFALHRTLKDHNGELTEVSKKGLSPASIAQRYLKLLTNW